MKKVRFDWLMLILTFVFSAVAVMVCLLMKDLLPGVVWSGLCFALPLVCALIGICITEYIRGKNCVIHKKGNRVMSFVLAIVIGFGIGALGQLAFDALAAAPEDDDNNEKHIEETETDVIVTETTIPMDICLLLDCSGSMDEVVAACKNAMCMLVDELDEKHSLQVITFDEVCCDLTELTDDNKEYIKKVIRRAYGYSSDPNMALEAAYDTLSDNALKDHSRVLIVVSDDTMDDLYIDDLYYPIDVDDELLEKIIAADIKIYSLYNTTWVMPSYDIDNEKFAQYVKRSGGFVTKIDESAVSTDKLLEALALIHEDSVQIIENPIEETEEETKEAYSCEESLFPYGNEGMNVLKFFVRWILLVAFALLATYVMYYSLSVSNIIYGVIVGLAGALLLFATDKSIVFTALVYAVLFLTAFTGYYPTYEGE